MSPPRALLAGITGIFAEGWAADRDTVNRRLDLTESLRFATSSTDEVARFNRASHRSDGYLIGARGLLRDLQSYLDTAWKAR